MLLGPQSAGCVDCVLVVGLACLPPSPLDFTLTSRRDSIPLHFGLVGEWGWVYRVGGVVVCKELCILCYRMVRPYNVVLVPCKNIPTFRSCGLSFCIYTPMDWSPFLCFFCWFVRFANIVFYVGVLKDTNKH